MSQPVFETTIFDLISVNGRISKKLFEKIVTPSLEEIESLKEANKVLREAIGGLIHHCRDYAITEESFVIAMEVDKAIEYIAKADEIKGEKK